MRKLFLCLLLVGCSKTAPTPTPAPAVSATGREQTISLAKAHFVGDVLDSCFDFKVSGDLTTEKMKALGAQHKKQLPGAKDLPGTCGESFGDRLELSSCTFPQKTDGLTVLVTTRHYNFESAGQDDRLMQECLDMKGQWKAVPRDSSDYLRARAKFNTERGLKMIQAAR